MLHFPMDIDDAIRQHLSQIFPQADGLFIQDCMEEAKRRNVDNSEAILELCINLILDGQIPNDEIVYLGTKQAVTNDGVRDYSDVLFVDDEDIVTLDDRESTRFSHGEYLDEMNARNSMAQPDQTTSPSYSSLLHDVTQILPGVDCDRVKLLFEQGQNLNDILNHFLESSHLQSSSASEPGVTSSPPQPGQIHPAPREDVNYFEDYSSSLSFDYKEQCLALLKNNFRQVYVYDIRTAWRKHNYHYAPTRKYLEECLVAMGHSYASSDSDSTLIPMPSASIPSSSTNKSVKTNKSGTMTIHKLLARKRNATPPPKELDEQLMREIGFVKKQKMVKEEKLNEIYAMHLNEQQYKEEGQLIECGCCFGEFPFEDIVQCSDGHLFCLTCLESYSKEVIFGSAIATVKLHCMVDGCTKQFPYSQLQKCLSEDEIAKYQDRLQEDCLSKVDLGPNLVHCPFCEFAAIVPEDDKVFKCLNQKCGKVTCKECEEEWADHFGFKCSEVEKKSQTNLRLSYEEKMTMAKVRKCPKCSCQFTKSDGCNKMTCRCSQTMCYLCRKPAINYSHFCSHPRDPGHKCTKCTACSLWTDPTEDDELAVKQLEQEAKEAKRKLDEDSLCSSPKKRRI